MVSVILEVKTVNKQGFEKFLTNQEVNLTEKAIKSRMTKARKAETILNASLDIIVASDDLMFDSLIILKENENPKHSPMQNAVRKYYVFKNEKAFPQLRYYKRR